MKFSAGDKVMIDAPADLLEWDGLHALVVDDEFDGEVYLKPLSERPDGYKRNCLFWPASDLVLVQQAPLTLTARRK